MKDKMQNPAEINDIDLDAVAGGKNMNKLVWDPCLEQVGGTHDDDFTLNGGTIHGTTESTGHYTQVVWANTRS